MKLTCRKHKGLAAKAIILFFFFFFWATLLFKLFTLLLLPEGKITAGSGEERAQLT